MAAKTFNLGDGTETGSGSCGKICMITCCILIVGIVIALSIFAYKSNVIGISECNVPDLDENGLSNWTTGAIKIAYACFPGFFLEGDSNVMEANCENNHWVPSPPACNFLPLRLDCEVNYKGLSGNISMWQKTLSDPTFLYGFVDYSNVSRSEGSVVDAVMISKATCQISNDIQNIPDTYSEPSNPHFIKIDFNSTELKAFNKAEVHITLIFVDKVTTATLVSVHQSNLTLVMSSSIPTKKAKKYLQELELDKNDFDKQ